jgi:type I restriction enzyme, S subunit
VSFIIQLNKTKKHIELFASGSVRQILSFEGFARLVVIVPELCVIEKFNQVYSTIQNKVKNNNNQIQILSRLRDTLLPKLMSGELRVNY